MESNEELTWSEYVSERCKKIFNTDDLNQDKVCEYVIQSAIRDNKTVKIEENTLIGMNQWEVYVNDDENTSWHFCIHIADTKEECDKWVKDNGLKLL
jgi:hypothetical protein